MSFDAGKYAFISYSSKNQRAADTVRRILIEGRYPCWMAPYDIPAGSKYAYVINDAIESCGCFVLLLSVDSQASVFVGKELERAIAYRRPVVAIRLDDVVLDSGFSFYLGDSQIIDVRMEGYGRALEGIASYIRPHEASQTAGRTTAQSYRGNGAGPANGNPGPNTATRTSGPYYGATAQPARGNMHVNTKAPAPQTYSAGARPMQKKPWYANSWVIALFLYFLAPVGLVLMWSKRCTWKVGVKVTITIVLVALYFGIFLSAYR